MAGYKYKVKLIPGTSKRGKSAKQARDAFLRLGAAAGGGGAGSGSGGGGPEGQLRQREAGVLRAVPDQQLMSAMLGGVKLSLPGLTKLKNADKGARKAGGGGGGGGGGKPKGEE